MRLPTRWRLPWLVLSRADDPWYFEEAALPVGIRRCGDGLGRRERRPHLVLTQRSRQGQGMRRGRDIDGVHAAQLLGVLEDARELSGKQLGFLFGERQSRELRDARYLLTRKRRHARMLPRAHEGDGLTRHMTTRPAAVAGTWYPGRPDALGAEIDALLDRAGQPLAGDIRALIAPHAGLMFSGAVGAHAYRAAASSSCDVLVLVGPSHFAAFDGVALFPEGAFETPLGPVPIDEAGARALEAFPVVRALPAVHRREHALEMQLPFVRRVFPDVPMVPLLIGSQNGPTILALADALADAFRDRRALLVASTDLSHYFDARTAARLDARVTATLDRFDPDALLALYEDYPEAERGRSVACGGGAAIAVLLAARALGATEGQVLAYAHSGEISGDYDGVVGYVAAAFGRFGGGEIGSC